MQLKQVMISGEESKSFIKNLDKINKTHIKIQELYLIEDLDADYLDFLKNYKECYTKLVVRQSFSQDMLKQIKAKVSEKIIYVKKDGEDIPIDQN